MIDEENELNKINSYIPESFVSENSISYNEVEIRADPLSKEELVQNYWDQIATPDIGYETNLDGKLMSHMTVIVD